MVLCATPPHATKADSWPWHTLLGHVIHWDSLSPVFPPHTLSTRLPEVKSLSHGLHQGPLQGAMILTGASQDPQDLQVLSTGDPQPRVSITQSQMSLKRQAHLEGPCAPILSFSITPSHFFLKLMNKHVPKITNTFSMGPKGLRSSYV